MTTESLRRALVEAETAKDKLRVELKEAHASRSRMKNQRDQARTVTRALLGTVTALSGVDSDE